MLNPAYQPVTLRATGAPNSHLDVVMLALDAPADWVERHRHQLERQIRDKIEEVRTLGYCAGPNIVMPGVAGMAAPVPSATREPYMSLSISAIEERLHAERVRELAPRLLKTARAISEYIE